MQTSGSLHDIQTARKEDVPSFVSPRRVVSELNVWRGDHVLDYVSGAGHFVPHLCAAVGGDGRVYARNQSDVHHGMLVRDTVARGRREVTPLLHATDDVELDIVAGTIDAVLLTNVLSRETSRIEPLLSEIERVVRREGKLCVVDWRVHENTERALIELLAQFGFTPKRNLSPHAVGWYHYGILFSKT